MKIIKNEKLIKRNNKLGLSSTIAGFVSLGACAYFLFQPIQNAESLTTARLTIWLATLFLGFIFSQIGMYMGNRWGRSPRPDELLDASLKGLPGDFSIYHFVAPAHHFLVGPAGVWVLLPYRQRGIVTYTKNRWRIGSGGFMQAYMSIFGQEGIGRPDLEAEHEIYSLQKILAKNLSEGEIPNVQAVLVFTHDLVEIQANDAPRPALKPKQLKDFMRQRAKERPITPTQLAAVKAALPE